MVLYQFVPGACFGERVFNHHLIKSFELSEWTALVQTGPRGILSVHIYPSPGYPQGDSPPFLPHLQPSGNAYVSMRRCDAFLSVAGDD